MAGIKLSSTVALPSVDMGAKYLEVRDTSSDDSTLWSTELSALKIDYNWKYCAYWTNGGGYAATTSRIEMSKDNPAAFFNGVLLQNGEYMYAGYRKYKVIKTSDILRVYNGYGANVSGGNLTAAYAAVVPCYSGSGWNNTSHVRLLWSTFKSVPTSDWGSYKTYSSQSWDGSEYTNAGWWQTREWGKISAAGTMECNSGSNKAEYHITGQSYEREDNIATDRIINVFNSSDRTILYSLNKWDGMGFSKFVSSTGTKWDNDFGLKITAWNSIGSGSSSTGKAEYVAANEDINESTWRATTVSNVPIRNVLWNEVRYENVPTIYNSAGSTVATKINLNSNIPLVNITSDGVIELRLEFNNANSKKIWLDTVLASSFSSKRSTALTPEGYTLDSTGGFDVSGTNVTLNVPVKKNTTVMIKVKRNSTATDCILTLPSEYKLTIEG